MVRKREFIKFSAFLAFTGLMPLSTFAKPKNIFTDLIKKSEFEKNTSFMAVDLRSNKFIGRHNEKLGYHCFCHKMVTASYYLTH